MAVSPHTIVRLAPAHTAEALIPEPSWAELLGIASHLPACGSSVGFECRLGGEQIVDLGVSVSRSTSGAAVLGGRLGDAALDRATAADIRWLHLRDFAYRWSDPASPLATRIPFLFLELDAGAHDPGPPVPSVFLGLDWLLSELTETGLAEARAGLDAVLESAGGLRSQALDPTTIEVARERFGDLPPGGVLLHAGVMLSRPGESLRLSVVVPRGYHRIYMDAIGRRDCVAAMSAAVARYGEVGGFPHPGSHLQLDFDPAGADTRLGLTLRPDDYRMWPALLRLLVEDGLCQPARAEGLLRWSGVSMEEVFADAGPCLLARTIEHVKLVCHGGKVLGAKAYFGATPE